MEYYMPEVNPDLYDFSMICSAGGKYVLPVI